MSKRILLNIFWYVYCSEILGKCKDFKDVMLPLIWYNSNFRAEQLFGTCRSINYCLCRHAKKKFSIFLCSFFSTPSPTQYTSTFKYYQPDCVTFFFLVHCVDDICLEAINLRRRKIKERWKIFQIKINFSPLFIRNLKNSFHLLSTVAEK